MIVKVDWVKCIVCGKDFPRRNSVKRPYYTKQRVSVRKMDSVTCSKHCARLLNFLWHNYRYKKERHSNKMQSRITEVQGTHDPQVCGATPLSAIHRDNKSNSKLPCLEHGFLGANPSYPIQKRGKQNADKKRKTK